MSSTDRSPPIPPQQWRRYRGARARPDDLLATFDIVDPAVDVFGIARALGIDVREEDIEHAGEVDGSGSQAIMLIRSSDPRYRRRFTAAHELGHLLLHDLGVQHRDDAYVSGSDPKERQANQFAAGLLMPFWMLDPLILRYGADADKLASLFDVSRNAMSWRLHNFFYP